MARGISFEEKALNYLKFLFEQLGFPVTEARQQKAGTQNGFDIRIGFLDDNKKERKFYFECKDYKTEISWNDIAIKIQELHSSNHQPDGFIALSPHTDFSNIHINIIDKLTDSLQTPIKYWTPETNVQDYFSLNEYFFEYVYKKRSETSEKDKELTRQKIRCIILDMLRQRDNLASVSFTKELTLKIPRIHQSDIIGRMEELEELHHLLFNNDQTVLINGLGGIGKTTLAQGYISKYLREYKNVAWITQITNDIISDITNTEGLAENLSVSKHGKEIGRLFYEIINRMKSMQDSPSLLIIDNVDENMAKLKDYLPGQPHWHVLITSRNRIEGFCIKELDFLSPEKAIALFRKHCSRITDVTMIAELVKNVDYHTLTIEILAKTAQRQRAEVETLNKAITYDIKSNVYIQHKGEKITSVSSYLSSIFNLSALNEEETWLMKQFVCLPAEFHNYERLMQLIDPEENKKSEFIDLLNELVEHGWLLHNVETDAYKMHLIVRNVVMKKLLLELNDIERLLNNIIGNLEIDVYLKDNPVNKFNWISFGNSLLDNFQDDTSEKIANLQYNLALVLQHRSDYRQAKELLEKALRSTEQNFGSAHPNTAKCISNLASVLQDLGDYDQAKELSEKALRLSEQNFGLEHPNTESCYCALASVLQDLGDFNQARVLLEKALHLSEQIFGFDHPNTANCYSDLGSVIQDLGDSEGARVLFEKALRLNEQYFGLDHHNTSKCYLDMASVLQDLGDFDQAKLLLEKALHSDEKNYGSDHPTTATSYANLGLLLKELGDFAQAKILLEKALHSNEKNYGSDHPSTAENYSDLGSILLKLGNFDHAKILLDKALCSFEKNFGLDDYNIAIVYCRLALLYKKTGNYNRALELSQMGLSIFNKRFPEDHSLIKQAREIYYSISDSM